MSDGEDHMQVSTEITNFEEMEDYTALLTELLYSIRAQVLLGQLNNHQHQPSLKKHTVR